MGARGAAGPPSYLARRAGPKRAAIAAGSARGRAPLLGKRICITGASPGATGAARTPDPLHQVLRRAGAHAESLGEQVHLRTATQAQSSGKRARPYRSSGIVVTG